MSFYVAAYDTEAVYPWWETGQPGMTYEGARLDECLDGVRAVAEVHLRHGAPATFFIVGCLAQAAGARLREVLDHDLFELESHSSTHQNMLAIRDDAAAVRHELVDSKAVIEDLFGREVTGFTAPGGSDRGFLGETRLLEALWEAGYRYVRTLSWQPGNLAPAPLTQPFWFADDGFPELLEISAHAWHDNILTGPALGLPGAHTRHRPRGLPGLRSRHRARPRPGPAHLFPLLPSLVDPPHRPRRRADRPAARPRSPRRPDPNVVRRRVPAPGRGTDARPSGAEVRQRPGRLTPDQDSSSKPPVVTATSLRGSRSYLIEMLLSSSLAS